jgi:hypothetical protein
VWGEDGTVILPELLSRGAASLMAPFNGYCNLIARLIAYLSLHISFLRYALVGTVLAWLFVMGVAAAIALAPLKVQGSLLLLVSVLLVPSDPEVYGVPLYTFWWAGLLLMLVVLWDERSVDFRWRIAFVVLGGLSSPIILLVLPPMWLRAYRNRGPDRLIASLATVCAVIQLLAMRSGVDSGTKTPLNLHSVLVVNQQFLGRYSLGNLLDSRPTVLAAAGIATLLLIGVVLFRNWRDSTTCFLCYLWLGTIAMTIARLDISLVHPAQGGPRYFFYPFLLESWFLIHLAFIERSKLLRLLAVVMLSMSVLNALPVLSRNHVDLHWDDHVRSAVHFEQYQIPIQFDGTPKNAGLFQLSVTGPQCRLLLDKDSLAFAGGPHPTYPFTARTNRVSSTLPELARASTFVTESIRGSGYEAVESGDFLCIRPFTRPDRSGPETGCITLRLRKGDCVFLQTGTATTRLHVKINGSDGFLERLPPVTLGTVLQFSNALLPQEFTVSFLDNSNALNEWLAISLRK